MNSHQVVKLIIRKKFEDEGLKFFDSLTQEEQTFIQHVVMTQPRALEINLSLPEVNILVSQLEFDEQDIALLTILNNLRSTKLNIKIALNEIIKTMDDADSGACLGPPQCFDLAAHQSNDISQFITDLLTWRQNLQLNFLQNLSLKLSFKTFADTVPYTSILKNLNSLYLKYPSEVNNLIMQLLPFLSVEGVLSQSLKEVDEGLGLMLKKAIIVSEKQQGFILHAGAANRVEEVKFLLEIMNGSDIKTIDDKGNTLWHVVDHVGLFNKIYKIFPDLNIKNLDGNTPLHLAVQNGVFIKIQFLLLKGVNTTILNNENQNCWGVTVKKPNLNLELFIRFAQSEFTITYPPLPLMQKGPSCGFYAAALVINYYILQYRDLFSGPYVLARKSDYPKWTPDQVSLRHLGRQKNLTQVGEILLMEILAELIEDHQCPTSIHPIDTYNNFIAVLKKALKEKQPVIIPYCLLPTGISYTEDAPLEASRVHLATCISIREQNGEYYCLLAHGSGLEEINAKGLYHAFYDMPDILPKLYFYKMNGEWNKFLQPQTHLTTECRVVESTSLNFFRRQLLVTHPPQKRASLKNVGSEHEDQTLLKRQKHS